METSWAMHEANGVSAMSLMASVFTGILVAFIMGYSAGPYREPFWLAAIISAGSGATITTVVHVLNEASSLSIWQVMVFGAGCGALGVLAYSLITPEKKSPSTSRNSGGQNRAAFRSAREPWRVPRASCRAGFSTPDFQKRKLSARGQETAQQ